MLNILKNYKTLFLYCVKNEISESGNFSVDTSNTTNKLDDILKEKIIDGINPNELSELDKTYDSEKSNISSQTKMNIRDLIKTTKITLPENYETSSFIKGMIDNNVIQIVDGNAIAGIQLSEEAQTEGYNKTITIDGTTIEYKRTENRTLHIEAKDLGWDTDIEGIPLGREGDLMNYYQHVLQDVDIKSLFTTRKYEDLQKENDFKGYSKDGVIYYQSTSGKKVYIESREGELYLKEAGNMFNGGTFQGFFDHGTPVKNIPNSPKEITKLISYYFNSTNEFDGDTPIDYNEIKHKLYYLGDEVRNTQKVQEQTNNQVLKTFPLPEENEIIATPITNEFNKKPKKIESKTKKNPVFKEGGDIEKVTINGEHLNKGDKVIITEKSGLVIRNENGEKTGKTLSNGDEATITGTKIKESSTHTYIEVECGNEKGLIACRNKKNGGLNVDIKKDTTISVIPTGPIEVSPYETEYHTIETDQYGFSMTGANGEKVYISKPEFERRNLEGDSLSRYNSLVEVLDIWNANAIKVAVGDAFLDSTENNIKKSVLEVSNILKTTKNDIFSDTTKYQNLIGKILGKIIRIEDNERDIIDEEDMISVKTELLGLNQNNSEQKMLKIYDLMRNSAIIFDNGDSTIVKEKIGLKLLEDDDFLYIGEIIKDLSDVEGEITQSQIEKILNKQNAPNTRNEKINTELKKRIKDFALKLQLEQNKQYKQIKIGYEQLVSEGRINSSLTSLDDYKSSLIRNTFIKNIKHILLKANLESVANRGDQKNTLKGKYADIIGLAENKGVIGDFFDSADENIDAQKELAFAIATSLTPAGLAYGAVVKGVQYGVNAYKLGKTSAGIAKVAGFAGRNIAGYSASIAYQGARAGEGVELNDYTNIWNLESLGEFMLMDGLFSAVTGGAKFIKEGKGLKLGSKTLMKFDSSIKKIIPSLGLGAIGTESIVNTARVMDGKEIELSPGEWSQDEIGTIMMFAVMHGVGKYVASRGKGGEIKIGKEIVQVDKVTFKKTSGTNEASQTINKPLSPELQTINKPLGLPKLAPELQKGNTQQLLGVDKPRVKPIADLSRPKIIKLGNK